MFDLFFNMRHYGLVRAFDIQYSQKKNKSWEQELEAVKQLWNIGSKKWVMVKVIMKTVQFGSHSYVIVINTRVSNLPLGIKLELQNKTNLKSFAAV